MLRTLVASAAIALLLTACGGAEPDAPTLGRWAADICQAAQTFEDEIAVFDDGVDAAALTVEARQIRSRDRAAGIIATAREAQAALEAITPAAGTADYHTALTAQMRVFADTWEDAGERMEQAQTATDIESLNAELSVALGAAAVDVAATAAELDTSAVAALRGVTRCGGIV